MVLVLWLQSNMSFLLYTLHNIIMWLTHRANERDYLISWDFFNSNLSERQFHSLGRECWVELSCDLTEVNYNFLSSRKSSEKKREWDENIFAKWPRHNCVFRSSLTSKNMIYVWHYLAELSLNLIHLFIHILKRLFMRANLHARQLTVWKSVRTAENNIHSHFLYLTLLFHHNEVEL